MLGSKTTNKINEFIKKNWLIDDFNWHKQFLFFHGRYSQVQYIKF